MSELIDESVPTYQDFENGTIERIVQARKYPKILAIWPHGDEPIGPMLGHFLRTEAPNLLEHVDYLCGNPRAAAETPPVRYTADGTDLNRSFGTDFAQVSYERGRAEGILKLVAQNEYDYVMDLHTSLTSADRCLIVDSANLATHAIQNFIQASPVRKIIAFPSQIAREGLIGRIPHAISIEYQKDLSREYGVPETVETIRALIEGEEREHVPIEREIYHVDGHIKKGEEPELGARDYELCEMGYYPILYGGTYKDDPSKSYAGFRAEHKTVELI